MKKIGLACVAILAGLSLAGCNNLASQSHKTASSSSASSTKVVKHHKSHKNKQTSSSSNGSSQAVTSSASNQQSSNAQQETVQSNNGGNSNNSGQQQAQPQSGQSDNSGEQVYTAHPSQGGTIYQTNGDAGSFQGDPDTIAETQIKMEQAAQRIENGQQ